MKKSLSYMEINWATFLCSLSNLQKISTVHVKALSFSCDRKLNDEYINSGDSIGKFSRNTQQKYNNK